MIRRGAVLAALAAVAVMTAGCASAEPVGFSGPHISRAVGGGPELAGQVQVVAYSSGNVRICTNTFVALSAGPPRVPACTDGLPVVGVDVGALTSTMPGNPARWGSLYLVGRYADGTFNVTSQRQWAPKTRGHDPFAKVPCPAPKGGWLFERSFAQERALRRYPSLSGHRDIDSVAFFGKGGSILTVASTHPGRTRAVLGPYGPRQLCVVHTRYAPKLVHAVRRRTVALLRFRSSAAWGWPNGGGGYGVSPSGQPTTALNVLLVTPKLQAFLNRQPPGIIAVDAALHPLRPPTGVPSLRDVLRITKNVPCRLGHPHVSGPDAVRRFHAVTAVTCGEGTRVYPGRGQWLVQVRKVAVSSVANLQRYFEQHSVTKPPSFGCTLEASGVLIPIFVDAKGHWLIPQAPVDGCNHPLGFAGHGSLRIRWHVVAVHKIRQMISAPALAAGCAMRMGRPTARSGAQVPPFFHVHPWVVRVCVYRTSARHTWIGNFVRGYRLDRSQTKRLLSALRLNAPSTACRMTTEFAEVLSRRPVAEAGVELGGCYRVNGGPGRADGAVVRAIVGSG